MKERIRKEIQIAFLQLEIEDKEDIQLTKDQFKRFIVMLGYAAEKDVALFEGVWNVFGSNDTLTKRNLLLFLHAIHNLYEPWLGKTPSEFIELHKSLKPFIYNKA